MQFRPLHDRVVGPPHRRGGEVQGWHHHPGHRQGEAAGRRGHRRRPGARDESGKVQPLDVKAGDRVLFGKWSGTEVRIDGEDLLIMKESDIMGIVESSKLAKAA
jgi:chaperonin GroES